MYDRPARSRIFVMLGGIIMNIILALGLIYAVALAWGLPDRSVQFTPTVDSTACAAPHQNPDGTLAKCSGTGRCGIWHSIRGYLRAHRRR